MMEMALAGMMWQKILASPVAVASAPPAQLETEDLRLRRANRNFYLQRARSTAELLAEREARNERLFEASVFSPPAETKAPEFHLSTLVIAPHPDDEILCCSRMLAAKIAEGASVKVLYITDGDGLAEEDFSTARMYGQTRRAESRAALHSLGLSSEDAVFLGFPDGHLMELFQKGSAQSTCTGRRISAADSFFPASPYTRSRLEFHLKTLLRQWAPAEIYLPAPGDDHPDHQAVYSLVRSVLSAEEKLSPTLWGYTVHRQECLHRRCPADRELDPQKWRLIQHFSSQRHDAHHAQFLDQFAAQEEVFFPLTK